MNRTVMFIHGAWLTPDIWNSFISRYKACGYACTAPAWPHADYPVRTLQENPPRALATLSIKSIADHYASLLELEPVQPVLVGHSFGGLILQMLLDRGLGAAGIAIAPVPPRGVLPGTGSIKSHMPYLLQWKGWKRLLRMPQQQFETHVAQNLNPAESALAFHRHIVPAPGRIFYQAAFGVQNHVDFRNDKRAPLLLIAAENDRTIQASMVLANYRLQRRSMAVTDYKLFPGRSNWLIAEKGWEDVADSSIEWLHNQSGYI